MALYKLLLKGFEFPSDLAPEHANFRFVFLLRHFDGTAESWVTVETVSPGLSTYWECDLARQSKPASGGKPIRDGQKPRFREPLPWDQVIVMLNSRELHQLRVVAIDVNRDDWVDVLRNLGESLVAALMGVAKGIELPPVVGAPVGALLEHVRTSVLGAMAKRDQTLFAADYDFGSDPVQDIILEKDGYRLKLRLEPIEADARTRLPQGRMVQGSAFARVLVDQTSTAAVVRTVRRRQGTVARTSKARRSA